jgi:hypothetical protein
MSKEKERTVDVKVDDQTIKITVKKPVGSIQNKANRYAAKVWSECLSDGIMTKKELKQFMKKRNIWDEQKDEEEKRISKEIAELERTLAFGRNGAKRVKASDGREIAIKIREKRIELRDLIGERLSLEGNTAESLSDNARFDFLVSCCTYYENGEKVYKSLEDYDENSDSDIALAAATAMAQMMYSLDKDFEKSLPENIFLNKHHFTNEDGALINQNGDMVDLDGRKINEFGHFLNDKGERVDIEGNLLDDNGRYITTVDYVEEKAAKKTQTREVKPKDG